jgi:hypothetical protein
VGAFDEKNRSKKSRASVPLRVFIIGVSNWECRVPQVSASPPPYLSIRYVLGSHLIWENGTRMNSRRTCSGSHQTKLGRNMFRNMAQ